MEQGYQYTARPATRRTIQANPNTRYWGIWLPIPTVIAIIVTLFFNWLIWHTVGYIEDSIEKAGQHIIEEF